MRAIARTILTAVAAAAAGTAAAHPGHATFGPLAGAIHLHALDIALALLAVGALALIARGTRRRRSR
ncbi:MAG: hypothetical protein U1E89_06230 [Burkholderiaceae bacterium]